MPEAATGLGRMRRSEDGGGRPAETVLAVRRSEDARRPPASFREQEEDEFYELLQREREKVAPAARSSVALLPGPGCQGAEGGAAGQAGQPARPPPDADRGPRPAH